MVTEDAADREGDELTPLVGVAVVGLLVVITEGEEIEVGAVVEAVVEAIVEAENARHVSGTARRKLG